MIGDVDVVLELAGDTDEMSLRSVGTLRTSGLLIAVPGGVSAQVRREADRRGVRTTPFRVEPDAPALARIGELIDAGEVRVEVHQTFPLADAATAHEAGEKGGTRGKSVLIVDEPPDAEGASQ